jgi:putative transposase
VDSKYTKIFVSNELTHHKYEELYDFAVSLREHKNTISKAVSSGLLKYLEYSKFQFVTEMRHLYKGVVPSSFDKHLYAQVFDCYQNKFDAIRKHIVFEVISFKGFEFYKRDTKKNKKGDLKRVIVEKSRTPLSTCLTYLARYGNVDTLSVIAKRMDGCDEKKHEFYDNIIRCCNKFGFERLLGLAVRKRDRTISRYSEKPIEFKSLSFSGRSRKTKIVGYNKRYGSVINSFVSLSGMGRKSFDIPVKFSKGYHGNMRDYAKKTNDYEYTITFNEMSHNVSVLICKDGERFIPEAGMDVVGIDTNCKHNLFSLSNGTAYDYDRKLVNDYCKLCKETDRLKEDNAYTVGKRRKHKLNVMKNKMVKSEQQLISRMCKDLKSKGVGHVVMEDLDNGFGRCYVKDNDNDDINYNRKVKFLGLSSLKQEVEHIARKYNIAVSTVHPSYTSKMCPVCGCIEDENRPNQETFECIECGHKDNADFNAAKNIRNRVTVTVLRDSLLKQLDNGAFEPRKLKRDKVKEVLLSYRTSLVRDRESKIHNFS